MCNTASAVSCKHQTELQLVDEATYNCERESMLSDCPRLSSQRLRINIFRCWIYANVRPHARLTSLYLVRNSSIFASGRIIMTSIYCLGHPRPIFLSEGSCALLLTVRGYTLEYKSRKRGPEYNFWILVWWQEIQNAFHACVKSDRNTVVDGLKQHV